MFQHSEYTSNKISVGKNMKL